MQNNIIMLLSNPMMIADIGNVFKAFTLGGRLDIAVFDGTSGGGVIIGGSVLDNLCLGVNMEVCRKDGHSEGKGLAGRLNQQRPEPG